MAQIITDINGSAIITMSDGMRLRIPGLNSAPNVTAQDIRNVCTAFFELADNLDKRLATIEGRATGKQLADTLSGPQGGDIPRR
jgi:hypothetical protein